MCLYPYCARDVECIKIKSTNLFFGCSMYEMRVCQMNRHPEVVFFSLLTCEPASHFEALTVFSKNESERARGPELGNQMQSGPRP